MIEKYYNEIYNNNNNDFNKIIEENNLNDEDKLNKILFVEFDKNVNEYDLKKIFSECKGFLNINMFNNKAFVEFDNIVNAQYAKIKLNNSKINNILLKISFAKK